MSRGRLATTPPRSGRPSGLSAWPGIPRTGRLRCSRPRCGCCAARCHYLEQTAGVAEDLETALDIARRQDNAWLLGHAILHRGV